MRCAVRAIAGMADRLHTVACRRISLCAWRLRSHPRLLDTVGRRGEERAGVHLHITSRTSAFAISGSCASGWPASPTIGSTCPGGGGRTNERTEQSGAVRFTVSCRVRCVRPSLIRAPPRACQSVCTGLVASTRPSARKQSLFSPSVRGLGARRVGS